MKLSGQKFKKYRKQLGLSQAQLADGICTQATVSLIEKQDRIPSMTIITKLSERLQVAVSDIIIDDNYQLDQTFNKLDKLFSAKLYDEAAEQLSNIGVKQLQTQYDKKRYYYYLGMNALWSQSDLAEAIFNFELVIEQFKADNNEIYQLLALTNLAIIKNRQAEQQTAIDYIDRVQEILNNAEIDTDSHFFQLMDIYRLSSEVLISAGNTVKAIEIIEQALQMARNNQSSYVVDLMYYQLSQAQLDTGDIDLGGHNLSLAYGMANINLNEDLKKIIIDQLRKLSLPIF